MITGEIAHTQEDIAKQAGAQTLSIYLPAARQMMRTMGCKAGQGLGRQCNGIQEPIKAFNQVARHCFGSGPNQRPTEGKTKTEYEKDMKKREEQQKKMEELNQFLAELPPSMRWFCRRTRKPLPLLREVAPGEDQSLKTVVDGFEKLALQN